ncbi:hypothetical protein SporoP33_04390 [Sporosarcina sp. P33]|nr:hypothetical protein SporoP33_04390 [Sporosarcina sp. P33]
MSFKFACEGAFFIPKNSGRLLWALCEVSKKKGGHLVILIMCPLKAKLACLKKEFNWAGASELLFKTLQV